MLVPSSGTDVDVSSSVEIPTLPLENKIDVGVSEPAEMWLPHQWEKVPSLLCLRLARERGRRGKVVVEFLILPND